MLFQTSGTPLSRVLSKITSEGCKLTQCKDIYFMNIPPYFIYYYVLEDLKAIPGITLLPVSFTFNRIAFTMETNSPLYIELNFENYVQSNSV